MKKYPHIYIAKGEFPLNAVAFIILFDGAKYGHYEEGFPPKDKFRMLRGLVLTKQQLVDDLKYMQKFKN